jgi:FAD/FMN-containing dehydrogenase
MKRRNVVIQNSDSKTLHQIDAVSQKLQALRRMLASGEHVTQSQITTLEEELERLWEQRRNEMAAEFVARLPIEEPAAMTANEAVVKETYRRIYKKSASRKRARARSRSRNGRRNHRRH